MMTLSRNKRTEDSITLLECVTLTFYKNKIFVQIGVHIKMHIEL
jgi:hypothetical protein